MAHETEAGIVSAVIPTLNEAARLPGLLDDLAGWPQLREIVVADGGSRDGTQEIARTRGCTVVESHAGRGPQLRAGIGATSAAWLLILHADARLTPAAIREAVAATGNPRVQCGVWPLSFGANGAWLRVVEMGAALRWKVLGLAYGDQGLLVRRTLYEACGGYRELTIMEDVDFIRRLNRRAPVHRFANPIVADPRRYLREGKYARAATNLIMLALFLAGVSPERLARWYRPEPVPVS